MGLLGGSRVLAVSLEEDIGSLAPSSLGFLATMRGALFFTHLILPQCPTSPQAQKQSHQVIINWNLWNHEPQSTFPALSRFLSGIFVMTMQSWLTQCNNYPSPSYKVLMNQRSRKINITCYFQNMVNQGLEKSVSAQIICLRFHVSFFEPLMIRFLHWKKCRTQGLPSKGSFISNFLTYGFHKYIFTLCSAS